jgi:hypothetical protein
MKTKTIVRDKAVSRSVLSASMVILALTLFGCLVAAVPMIINATKGSSISTATVLINRDAATVYADAVKVIKQRGYTKITKQDNANYFLEGVRKGKNATLKVAAVGSNQSRVIITIENDKEAKDINEAVQALMQTCRQLGVQCQEQKG